jgi:hypothetical protein
LPYNITIGYNWPATKVPETGVEGEETPYVLRRFQLASLQVLVLAAVPIHIYEISSVVAVGKLSL